MQSGHPHMDSADSGHSLVVSEDSDEEGHHSRRVTSQEMDHILEDDSYEDAPNHFVEPTRAGLSIPRLALHNLKQSASQFQVAFDAQQFTGLRGSVPVTPVSQRKRPSTASSPRMAMTPERTPSRPQSAVRASSSSKPHPSPRPMSASRPMSATARAYTNPLPPPSPNPHHGNSTPRSHSLTQIVGGMHDVESLQHELWTAKKLTTQLQQEQRTLNTKLIHAEEDIRKKDKQIEELVKAQYQPDSARGAPSSRQDNTTFVIKLKEIVRQLRNDIKNKEKEIMTLKASVSHSHVLQMETEVKTLKLETRHQLEQMEALASDNARISKEQRQDADTMSQLQQACVALTKTNAKLKAANQKWQQQCEGMKRELDEAMRIQHMLASTVKEAELAVQHKRSEQQRVSRPPFQCVKTLYGHADSVLAVVVGEDRVYTGSWDSTVRVWNPHSFECVGIWEGCERGVFALAIRKNVLLVGGGNYTLRLLDAVGGRLYREVLAHQGNVYSIVVLGDGRVATSSADCLVKIWNIGDTDEHPIDLVGTLQGHRDGVRALAVSETRNLLFSGSDDKMIRVWDLKTLECTHILAGHSDWVCSLHFGAGGRLWSGSYREMKIWDLDLFKCADSVRLHKSHIRSILTKEDSLLTASGDCTIQVSNISTGVKPVFAMGGHGSTVWSIAFAGDSLWSASSDGTVKVWRYDL